MIILNFLYLFRSNKIPVHSKVIIYGYGNVGMISIHQIHVDNIYEIVGVADKKC